LINIPLLNPHGGRRAMNYVKLCILVFVFILAVSFAAENTEPITLAYYFDWETPAFPLYLLVFIPFFIGTVVGSLVGFGGRMRLRNTVRTLRTSNAELEEKLKQVKEAQIVREVETQMLEEKPTETEVDSTP
jgi:uncharacterized integral membrane protein